ncbi:hypothetical protein BC941DRAFT_466237 [Chlamydoabsidia padenii]|nr:hypothetical protein BC941DRAFT_466237 [Chlamydoabsidia padenii]
MKLEWIVVFIIQSYLSFVAANLTLHEEWKIGNTHSVAWDQSVYTQADTVNIFIDEDRSFSLGHTQALDGKLDFIVPDQLSKFKDQQVHVLAVFRRDFHLFNVESAAVRITG